MKEKVLRRLFDGEWIPPIGEIDEVSEEVMTFVSLLEEAATAYRSSSHAVGDPCIFCDLDKEYGKKDCTSCPLDRFEGNCIWAGKTMLALWKDVGYLIPKDAIIGDGIITL